MTGRPSLLLDVGGSSWRAELRDGDASWSARCSALPPIQGGELSSSRLRSGLEEIWSLLETTQSFPSLVAMATTGVARIPGQIDEMHEELHAWKTVRHTLVVSDAAASLAGALADLRDGCLMSVGTGVAAVARSSDGVWVFKDGWGPLLGDEGGGFWIGSQGLRAALRSRDGRSGGSQLLAAMAREEFGELAESWPLRGDLERAVQKIASFATSVLTAAEDGDEVAANIVDEACTRLVDTARAISSAQGVLIAGGLIAAPWFRKALFDMASTEDVTMVRPEGDALSGLALLETHGIEAFVNWAGELGSCRDWG